MVSMTDTVAAALPQHTQAQDQLEDKQLFDFRLSDIVSRMTLLEDMQRAYVQFCQTNQLTSDTAGIAVSLATQTTMRTIIQEAESDAPESAQVIHYSQYVTRQHARIRNLLLLLRQFCSHLEWASASYSQAVIPHCFDLRKQTGNIVNYDRWESFMIADMEDELTALYGLDEQWRLLLASSGMAAYATLHNYMTRHLTAGDHILLPMPIYHEAEALLASIPAVQLNRLGSTNVDTIVASITPQTKVIALTPITNDEALRFMDINLLVQKLGALEQTLMVVVDGTMTGGLIRPQAFIHADSHITLLYFESGNKYQQFEDTGMKGIMIVPRTLQATFISIRRELGTILYDQIASALPQGISDAEQRLKMGRFARNALLLSDRINNDPRLQTFCKVNYPFNAAHPDVDVARRYALHQMGGVVMFSFYDEAYYNKERLEQLIQALIERCQRNHVPFCKGDSYGFSIPRIHVGGSRTDKPFLRLCVGHRSVAEMNAFLTCVVDCLYDCVG